MTPDSVLMVTPLWGRDGGVAAHVKASAALLGEHGLHVRVLAAQVDDGEEVPGVIVHRNPDLFNASVPIDARLGEAMSFGPSVIHLHQFEDPVVVEAMRASAPVVISAHGYVACSSGRYYFHPGQECTRAHGIGCMVNLVARGCAHTWHVGALPSAYGRVTRGIDALRQADLAISYSTAVDRHLAANDVTPRKVVPLFTTTIPRAGSGHGARRRVVFAGRLVAPKGVAILIRAAREVDAEFVICGDGRLLEPMRKLARRLGVERRICFKGWLDADQVAEELANASVVAIPSLWPEPFGLVGIEALAAGRPVVASSTGGIVDWLEDDVNGLCVRPGAPSELARALNELLADPERQRAMGQAGREMVAARFSPERHIAALIDGYRGAQSNWRCGEVPSAAL